MVQGLINYARKQRSRRDVKAFASLITTPGSGAFSMPANGTLLFRSVAGCAAGTTAATFKSRTIETPLLNAGESVKAGYVEKDVEVTPATGFEVLVDTGLGRTEKIGEGV